MKLRVQQLERALAQQLPRHAAGREALGLLAARGADGAAGAADRDLLDVSRINESRLDLRVEPTDLSALVAAGPEHLREQLARPGCTLELEAQAPVGGTGTAFGWSRCCATC